MEKIQLKKRLQVFTPKNRQAILLNNYDRFEDYSQIHIHARGNKRINELEAILSGHFSYKSIKQKKFIDESLRYFWASELKIHEKNRKKFPYDLVIKILPEIDMRERISQTLNKMIDIADENTLTFVYITSHGEIGSFAINNTEKMRYSKLLDKLDRIKGKKILTVFTCYSGSILDELKNRQNKRDYIVLTSTNKNEKGVNWGEDELHSLLIENISNNKLISNLILPEVIEGHHPQIIGYYDVRL